MQDFMTEQTLLLHHLSQSGVIHADAGGAIHRGGGRAAGASHPLLTLVRIAEVPHDLALAGHLEQAPGHSRADEGVAVGQALAARNEGGEKLALLEVGPVRLLRAEGLSFLPDDPGGSSPGSESLPSRGTAAPASPQSLDALEPNPTEPGPA